MTASAVTTPHPPAVVSTATREPRGSGCVANVAAASNASSTVPGRVAPAWWHMPSKIRSSDASAPVCEAAARWPPAVTPPFRRTSGLRRATLLIRSKKPRPSETPSTYASATVVASSAAKYSRKSGTVTAAAFPAETARLTPMLVCTA